ncbi:MAG: immune inhibitor A [Anaerolineales bacterium]
MVYDSFTRSFDIEWQARNWDVSTATPIVVRPTIEPTRKASKNLKEPEILTPDVPESEIDEFADHSSFDSRDILTTLEQITVPVKDMRALVQRLEGKEDLPLILPSPTTNLIVGAHEDFWVTNVDDDRSFQVEAILQYITEHAYIWIEEGVHFDSQNLERFAEEFENKIYPNTRAFFGSEWTPGVDSDPHVYILYVSGLGSNLAGYFSSIDEYPPQVHEYSNGHELIVLNADNLDLDNGYSYGVLAHEFQHMVHWYRDRNETAWLNEGFSELAAYLNGFDVGGFDQRYFENPDLQLNDWPSASSKTSPHYGAAYLFLKYFYDRFGEFATQLLVAHPGNSLFSVDAVLNEIDVLDSTNGDSITADDFFLDWVVASYLQDDLLADGRYSYNNYPEAPRPTATETIDVCPTDSLTRDVHQYGVDYIRITCPGDHTLHFEGSIQVNLLPEGPHSGDYAFWSNRGSESNMTLTRTFDFSNHLGPLTMSYWTWYDLEEDYDYLYLEASIDGKNWQIITTPSGTPDDPTGNSFGWGYNGLSGGGVWIHEQVELSRFAGEKVQIRFEYVTDAAVNGEGFLLDDIAIPQIGYYSDFEADSGGWEADGFVRILNQLPQHYLIGLISIGERTTVEKMTPSYDNSLDISLHVGEEVQEVILVVSGSTRFTKQKATYRLELNSAE